MISVLNLRFDIISKNDIMKTFVILTAVICLAIIVPAAVGHDPCAGNGMEGPVRNCPTPDVCCCRKCPECTCTCQGKSVVVDPTCLWTQHSKPHDCVCDCPAIQNLSCDDVCKTMCRA